jgi:heme/copper-type cytochrome/quinol oxidase subunit 3
MAHWMAELASVPGGLALLLAAAAAGWYLRQVLPGNLLHVLGGTVVNAYFWGPGSAMFKTEPEHFANRVEVAGLFWHFVDLVWLFLFPVLYLI